MRLLVVEDERRLAASLKRGLTRDGVRLLVSERASGRVGHHAFTDLPALLRPGDVLVVNTSATIPAAVPVAGSPLTVHFSTEPSDGGWLVELRRHAGKATAPHSGGVAGRRAGSVAIPSRMAASSCSACAGSMPSHDGRNPAGADPVNSANAVAASA